MCNSRDQQCLSYWWTLKCADSQRGVVRHECCTCPHGTHFRELQYLRRLEASNSGERACACTSGAVDPHPRVWKLHEQVDVCGRTFLHLQTCANWRMHTPVEPAKKAVSRRSEHGMARVRRHCLRTTGHGMCETCQFCVLERMHESCVAAKCVSRATLQDWAWFTEFGRSAANRSRLSN